MSLMGRSRKLAPTTSGHRNGAEGGELGRPAAVLRIADVRPAAVRLPGDCLMPDSVSSPLAPDRRRTLQSRRC